MSYGLQFMWNEVGKNDPVYREGYIYLTLKHSFRPTIFGGISKQWKGGILSPKYWYVLRMNFVDADSGRSFGGYYKTLDEAKYAANKFLHIAFYDPRDYGPQQPETVKE